jgi:GlcNAc-P-P-Und epimerase
MEFSQTVLVTGSSGFIGLNIVNKLRSRNGGFKIVAVDKRCPKHKFSDVSYFKLDLKNFESTQSLISEIRPDVIIHLAGRTDLNGKTLEDYSDNISPVENICRILEDVDFVKTVIFTSSMLVHVPGKCDQSFSYDTVYGESKALGESIIRDANLDNIKAIIVRPTSIWGPEFEEPYKNFFVRVISGRYFLFGPLAEPKTFGYVGNTVNQILSLCQSKQIINKEIFYLGDTPPQTVDSFACQIQKNLGKRYVFTLPRVVILLLAKLGDVISKYGVKFPLTSFRLRNISTENIVDVSAAENINVYPKIEIDDGIIETFDYLGKNQ